MLLINIITNNQFGTLYNINEIQRNQNLSVLPYFLRTQTPSKHYRERERERERERVLTCDRRGVPTSGATQNTEMESNKATDRGEAAERRIEVERRVFEVWRVRWEGSLKCGWVNETERDCESERDHEVKSEREEWEWGGLSVWILPIYS